MQHVDGAEASWLAPYYEMRAFISIALCVRMESPFSCAQTDVLWILCSAGLSIGNLTPPVSLMPTVLRAMQIPFPIRKNHDVSLRSIAALGWQMVKPTNGAVLRFLLPQQLSLYHRSARD